MSIPRATMRLQLHKGFTFGDAARLAPYMARLGISHLYCSPILAARAGSMHGYDVADPSRINPELGGEDGFRRMVGAMRAAGLGIIVDIVPNHMAAGQENPWWQDMLRHGRHSRYGHFFDVDWEPDNPLLRGKILLPVLGDQYGEVLARGEIGLERDEQGFSAAYFDKRFPIRPEDTAEIERLGVEAYGAQEAEGRARLHRLLERQHWRLAFWRTAPDEINWRRFFDINELAGLRAELPDVFQETHATLFRLYAEGLIDGVRVDHVDGLSDPRGYCRALRSTLSRLRPGHRPWIVVEKILGAGETLPGDWEVDGTSGYDFMDLASAVQHDPGAADALGRLWHEVSGRPAAFEAEEAAARREILKRSFTAPLEAATGALHAVALESAATRDLSRPAIRRALVSLLAHFPAYRPYATGEARGPQDAVMFARALEGAEADPVLGRPEVMRALAGWLCNPDTAAKRVAATRFQQLSAPVAAKAVEDTAFYRYGRLISRNDVGFDAARLGIEVEAFHARNAARAAQFPHSMLATATHDHKRGEDARARLAVLSEMPQEWGTVLRRWMQQNARHRRMVRGKAAPAPGDEAILYQTLIGVWEGGADLRGDFLARVARWQEKALHEAKLATSWTRPDPDYEAAARAFLEGVLSDAAFVAEIADFVGHIAPAGALNGLAQLVLKLTVPGVPDFYQGTEFWDRSLVDPDNRRPVEFDARVRSLEADASPLELLEHWQDGRVKQAVMRRILACRAEMPAVFADGDYLPATAEGTRAAHVIAFARTSGDRAVLVIAPRWPLHLLEPGTLIARTEAWGDTRIRVPGGLVGRQVTDVLGDESRRLEPELRMADCLRGLPLAVLRS